MAGVGHNVALSGAQAARFEAQAIQLPLDELAARAQQFDQRIAELRAAGAEAGDLLERGIDRALASLVNEPLQTLARRQEDRLRGAVRQRAAELQRSSPRELANELQSWLDACVHSAFADLVPRFESDIANELTALETRYAARVRDILEEVQAAAQDVFGVRAGEVLPETGLRAPSRFSFKLHDVENALDMIVGFGRTVAPGILGRRLVVRAAEQRLIDMTDRHAGRLRSELAERATRAAHEYRRDLTTAVDEAVEAIRATIDRVTEDRRRGQRTADARLEEALTNRAQLQPHRTADAALARGPRSGRQPEDAVRPRRAPSFGSMVSTWPPSSRGAGEPT